MGQMLAETERAKGARATGSNQHRKLVRCSPDTAPPTLASIGVSKKESANAQRLAALPAAEFDAGENLTGLGYLEG